MVWLPVEKRTRPMGFLQFGLAALILFLLMALVIVLEDPSVINSKETVSASSPTTVEQSAPKSVTEPKEENTPTQTDEQPVAPAEEKVTEEPQVVVKEEPVIEPAGEPVVEEKPSVDTIDWNLKDVDALTNGNIWLAFDLIKSHDEDLVTGETVQPYRVVKTPWEYYGTPIEIYGTIEIVHDFPPGSDEYEMGVKSDIVIDAWDTIVEVFMTVPSGDFLPGEPVKVVGYVTGKTEVENRVGGTFTHLILVANAMTLDYQGD